MTPFEHLSVLISIIIGLGITHILSAFHQLVQARERVAVHWLPVTWAVLVFVALVQWWWASFGMRTLDEWNFFYFLFVLLRPVLLYLSAAFVLPSPQPGRVCDLLEHYYENRGWLFLLLAIGQVLDGVRRTMEGAELADVAVWSNFVSAALVGSLAVSANPRYHTAITMLTAALYALFILEAAIQLA